MEDIAFDDKIEKSIPAINRNSTKCTKTLAQEELPSRPFSEEGLW